MEMTLRTRFGEVLENDFRIDEDTTLNLMLQVEDDSSNDEGDDNNNNNNDKGDDSYNNDDHPDPPPADNDSHLNSDDFLPRAQVLRNLIVHYSGLNANGEHTEDIGDDAGGQPHHQRWNVEGQLGGADGTLPVHHRKG